MSDPSFASLMSLVQLSVGINLTFSVISSFFDPPLQIEKEKINQSLESTRRYIAKSRGDTKKLKQSEKELELLFKSISARSYKIANSMFNIVRPICIVAASIAFIFLLVGTFRPNGELGLPWAIVAVATVFPFIVFSLYFIFVTARLRAEFGLKRENVDVAVMNSLLG